MKLNSKEARRILEKEKTNKQNNWLIKYSIFLGDIAVKISKALFDNGI